MKISAFLATKLAPYLFTLPSFILQIVLIRTLIIRRRKHPFRNPFFRIFLLLLIVDCLQFTLMQLTVRIPVTGFALHFYLNLPEQLCTLISFVGWHFIIITHSLNALICVNRFTAIGWPTRYKNIWKVQVVYVLCASTLLLPIFYSYRWLFHAVRFFRFEYGATLEFVNRTGNEQMIKLRDSFILFATFGIFDLTVNIGAIILYRHSHKTTRFSRVERNLFIATLWMFIATILFAIFLLGLQSVFYGRLRFIRSFLMASSAVVVDVYMLSNTWILICVSRDVRDELRRVIFGKRKRILPRHKKRIVRSDLSIPLA